MTAFVCALRPTFVEVLADAGHYAPDGTIRLIGTKIAHLPGVGVVTGRGQMGVLGFFAKLATAYSTFDDVVATCCRLRADAVARAAAKIAVAGPGQVPATQHELLLAGWSESRLQPEVYFTSLGDPPDEWRQLIAGGVLVAGTNAAPRRWRLDQAEGWAAFDASRDGVPLFQAMRLEALPERERGGIGGLVERVTVRQLGVTRSVSHRWPEDRVGFRIGASRAA